MAKKIIRNAEAALTIHDREKYFDTTLSQKEIEEIMDRIAVEFDDCRGLAMAYQLINEAEIEIQNALKMDTVPYAWCCIHACRQLEIDYKAFAKNNPRLPIEPFYNFVEPLFPQFKQANNKIQLSVQTKQIHVAFVDWVDEACAQHGCTKSHHGPGCWDRFEKADYAEAASRISAHNVRRAKFTASPLRLVHSTD